MKSIFVLLLVAFTLAACNSTKNRSASSATPNMLTSKEKKDGWKLLFDGKTTDGWHKFREDGIGKSWIVEEGALTFDPTQKDGGDIVTDEDFEDFEFSVEWKILACGNSGIMYFVQETEEYNTPWRTGPEMQVLDNTCHPDAKIEKHRAGDLYDLIKCSEETVKPAGEWNVAVVRVKDGNLQHWLNGTKVVETTLWDDAWYDMIANSKFKSMPGFGRYQKGHIALQDHGDKVAFRNIKIREL